MRNRQLSGRAFYNIDFFLNDSSAYWNVAKKNLGEKVMSIIIANWKRSKVNFSKQKNFFFAEKAGYESEKDDLVNLNGWPISNFPFCSRLFSR